MRHDKTKVSLTPVFYDEQVQYDKAMTVQITLMTRQMVFW